MKKVQWISAVVALILISGCVSTPAGINPVKGFQLERYLGKWYEIARLDHRFERGMTDVSAEYSMREDGGVRVLNSGLVVDEGKRKESEGKAYFVEDENTGHLKVSFFGPFYGSYVIFNLDDDYQYSMITGNDRSYLWLLSRTPVVSTELLSSFKRQAAELGFATDELIIDNER